MKYLLIFVLIAIGFIFHTYNSEINAARASDKIYNNHFDNQTAEYNKCVYNTSCDINRYNAIRRIEDSNYQGPDGVAVTGLWLKLEIFAIIAVLISVFIYSSEEI